MHVLFVVSSSYWITAVEAREIMKHNPQIRGLLCSVPLLDELLNRAPDVVENIDLVHFMVPVAGRRYLDRFLGKIPCVATIYHLEPGYSPEAVSINSKADSIMIISEMWRAELISRGVPAERIFLMPNGVDTGIFRPPEPQERQQLRRSMGFKPDDIVIGFSGQPGRDGGWRKGMDVFINALEILAGQGFLISIVVGGPGWGSAVSRIRSMGIKVYKSPYVLVAEDGAPMYRALDFFWVTSRIEGGPAPLVEAMSSGVCCISTKVGIAPEIIEDGVNGCLVNVEDAAQIATLTRSLIEHREEWERMGHAARRKILAGYDWSQTAKQAPLLYDTALKHFARHGSSQGRQRDLSHNVEKETPKGGGGILPPRDARWLDAQEKLIWARELCRMGERKAAFDLSWRACLRYPFSTRVWSLLAKFFLSERVQDMRRSVKTGG